MFAKFFDQLRGETTAPLEQADIQIALAAIMVRIARSDESYDSGEIAIIDAVLARRFALTPEQADILRQKAEELEATAPDTVRFTRVIKSNIAYEDRSALITDLWHVVLADGQRDSQENALMRMLAHLLGVSDRDNALARQNAQQSPQ